MTVIVPAPPPALPRPNFERLPIGFELHSVHQTIYAGNGFNPCGGDPTRFAPILDASGSCVPSLYAGQDLESAIYETIFHDVPTKALFKAVPQQAVTIRSHSVLFTTRELMLVQMRRPDLKRWNVEHDEVVSAPASKYLETARWAEAIHRQFPQAQGMAWTSNQCDPSSAYLLFGDRVQPSDLLVAYSRPGTDESFIADVRTAGLRADITLSE